MIVQAATGYARYPGPREYSPPGTSLPREDTSTGPYTVQPQLVSCYGFKIDKNHLRIPLGKRTYHRIALTKHTLSVLSESGVRLCSFTLTLTSLSLTITRDVADVESTKTVGVDRNLRNLTIGNEDMVMQYDLSETARIAKTTRRIISSFKRDDTRIRRRVASKYGRRRAPRTNHLLHSATKQVVANAVNRREAIVLEDIRGIRALYERGNGQGRSYRSRMNAWPFSEAKKQIEYKSRWEGLPVIHLTRRETRGTSIACPRCGERLQSDKHLQRKLWCGKCRWIIDRDAIAAINIAMRGGYGSPVPSLLHRQKAGQVKR